MSYEQIELEARDGVARITMNRPEALNPLSLEMAAEMRSALEHVAGDPQLRAVLISGSGRGFCSGAALGGEGERALSPTGRPDVLADLRQFYNPLILAIRELPKPVVAAVNGPAAGIGCSLALACDQVVIAESAYLLNAFAKIGLTLDGGASVFLSARAGHARASEMAMLAERVPAARALEWGLVNRVVADDQLAAEAGALAARLAASPTLSYAASKRLLNASVFGDLAAQLDREAVEQQRLAESDDFGIGVLGFLSKQDPEFTGG